MSKLLSALLAFLYVLSELMLYPVVVALVGLVLWVIYYGGMMLREYVERRSGYSPYVEGFRTVLEQLPKEDKPLDILIEQKLQAREAELVHGLNRIRFVIRTAPALGLMGTLIPMGIALSSLAKGDIPQMAGNMVTAFTTTVVGLACGVVAYLLSLVKERWVKEDILKMEVMAELLLREGKRR